MNISSDLSPTGFQWHCVQTRPKQEKLAASTLATIPNIEVYCPFLRIQRVLPRGKVWFREALFPCYVFARFEPIENSRQVSAANGVSRILRFGGSLASIPDRVIEDVRNEMGGELTKDVIVNPREGDEGEIATGPLRGFSGIVRKITKGSSRAQLLIEILGGIHSVEISVGSLKTPRHAREFVSLSGS